MSQTNWNDFTPVDDKGAPIKPATVESGTNWDDFTPAPEPAGLLRKAGDLGLSVAKGVVSVPEAAVGIADIPTGGRVGKFLENEGGAFGFRPKQAKEYLSSLQSDDLQSKQKQFQQADGVLDKAGVALSNPSLIANAVAESVPLMGAGAVPARALLAAAPRVGAAAAGAIGEGVVGAGSAAEAIRQETPDGLLTPTQSGLAAATGATTSAFGFAGGKVAQRLGIGDVDTMFAQGAARAAGAPSAKSIPRQVVEGAIAEGWLEELPQSVSEQVLQNLALNKPWHEGVSDAAVMGTLAGMAMGGGAAGVAGFSQPTPEQTPPPNQPAPVPPPVTGPTLALPAPDRGVIQVAGDGTARTPAYQAPGYVGDVTDVEPRAIDPVREQVAAAAEQGGALSTAALTAIDTGLSDAMQPAPEQAPPQISLEEADARDRAAYEQFFANLDAEPVVGRYVENDDDIPDFDAASNASEEDFLRALGATDEDIQDAIATSSQSAIPQSSVASNAGPQAYESAGPREGAGEGAARQTGQVNAGAIQQAAPDAPVPGVGGTVGADGAGSAAAAVSGASGPGGPGTGAATGSGAGATEAGSARAGGRGDGNQALSAPANLRDALVRVRQQKQEAANAQAAQAPAPAAAPVPGPTATAVEAAGPGLNIKAITAKQIPDMTDAELQAAIEHYGPEHKRTAKLQKEVQRRAGAPSSATTEGTANVPQASQAQQASPQPTQAAAAPAAAAGLTDGAPAQNPGAQAAPAAGAQAATASEPEFTTIKTISGDSVTVRTADLNSDKPRLRQYTKDGKSKAVPAIHRDNLDLTGDKRAANAKEDADNPLFNAITTKDGSTFANQAAASRELNRLAMGETHEVVAASEVQDGAQGFVIRRKLAGTKQAQAATENVASNSAGQDEKSRWLKSVADMNRMSGQFGAQIDGVANGRLSVVGNPNATKQGRALMAAVDEARRAGATNEEIAAAATGKSGTSPSAAELTLDDQLKQVNDELASQGAVQNARTRAKRDQIRTAIAERDFPAILKAVDGDVGSAEAINQALQFAGDEPKAKVIERVLKNRGISDEYRQRWAERLMGEEGANNAVPAPPPGVVNVPPAIAAALDADMQAQKARITRLRNAATAEGMSLEEKKQAQTQLKGAEFTLQTMRRTRFDAEDAAIKAIEQNDMAPFAEHVAFFKTEKALQEFIGAAPTPAAAAAAAPAPKKKPNADQTRAKADLMAALADLGDILGKNTRMNITPEQEVKLLPVLTRVLDAAFRLGYHKFKDAAKFALDQIRANLGDEAADALTLDHLQGAYIAMAGGKQGVDTKRAVIDVETKAEIEAHTVVDPDAETDATIKPTMATADGRRAIAQTVADHMIGGNKFATINDARKFIEGITDSRIPPGTKQAKLADETVEVGVAIAARDIVSSGRKAGRTDEQIFNRLVSLYEAQPSLNVRDTDSLREQAYSTPAPLAFVASRLAKVSTTDKVGEPTGGNGMLLMEVAQQNAVVNELNDDRAGNLRAAGFEVTQNNAATSALAPAKSLDALVMNPPFGAVRDESGSTVTYTILPEYSTGEIDHAIVFKSLESMKDDGNAVLIIGGTLAESEQGRKEAYRGRAKRQFFFNLQQQYNVVDHFTVGGDLYKKQGTTYPVDVIVIRGRGQSARALPAADLPPIITTWAQLQEKLNGNNDGMGASRPGITGSNPSANGNSPEQSAVLEPAGPAAQADGQGIQPAGSQGSVRADGAGQPDGAAPGRNPSATNDAVGKPGNEAQVDRPGRSGGIPGASATQQQTGTNGTGERDAAGLGDGDSRSAGRARLSEEDAGKLQVKYQSFSGNKSVNTLVATNHLSALESAFDNLRKRVGNIDDYVRNSLQYSPEGFKKAFSAEQVEALALAIDNIERGRGFIIGDQTGIGKGRVVAAMIRYAKLNGKTPVFVTQMPDLYGDMMRDLNDIGMTDFKPLMTNNNAEVPLDAEALSWFGEVQAINTRVKELESAIEEILMGEGAADAGVKGVKASVNPEVVSLRDEIAELKASKPARTGKFLETPNIERHERDLAEFVKRGNIGDYGAIFTTYNQMAALDSGKPRRDKSGVKKDAAPPKFAYRNEFLQAMVNNNAMLILDESHNAGSAGDGKFPKVGDVVRLLVRKAGSVFYSSATFAKNPSVMDVYSKTDLGQAFASADQLSAALSSVPQQQVASSMLVENGQYIRRERSFDGIEYKIQEVESDTQAAEDVSTAMRLVVEFDDAKKAAVNVLKDDMDAQGATIAAAGGGGSMGSVDSTNFTSVMHNVINTFLLSLKADAAADVAIAAIKAGEKPVLTVANTMEMFIRDYAESAGLSAGDRLNATFGDVLMRYLEKTRNVRITGPNGDSETRILTDQELGPDGVAAYESAREFIASLKLEIPLSPIDHIKERIADAGYSIGEVTGRQSVVERGVIRPRNKAEMNTAGKKNTIAKFNGGQLDALIINRSGSTGLSMHASETFPDQRRRVMVVAQAELDINNHMQMLGRTNRTGQVTANGKSPAQNAIYGLPRYVQLTANVPIELRPAAVLAAKMASLSANTTAGRKSAVEDSSAPDFMNKYGDEVAALVVGNDPELNKRLGYPISIDMNGVPETLNAISKVTGRIGLLPLREQKAIYDRITNDYRDLIAQLDALGKNDLEAKTYALDAKTLETTEVIAGDGDSVFNAPVVAEKVDVKKLGKPYSSEKVKQLVEESLGGLTPAQHRNQLMEMFRKEANAEVAAARLKAAGDKNGPAALQQRMDSLNAAFTRFRSIVPTLGSPVVIKTSSNGNIYGIPISIQRKKGSQSVGALSAWVVKYAVVDGSRVMGFPLSQVFSTDNGKLTDSSVVVEPATVMNLPNEDRTGFVEVPVLEAFDRGQTDSREVRYVMTGNLLRAGGKFSGRLISYTTADGDVRQGLLTPVTFDLKAAQAKMTPELTNPQQMVQFLDAGGQIVDRETGGDIVNVRKTHRYEVTTSKTGKGRKIAMEGGLYMASSGTRMRGNVLQQNATDLIPFFEKVTGALKISLTTTPSTKDLVPGGASASFSRAPTAAPSRADSNARNVATQILVDGLKAKWTRAPEIIVARNMQDAKIPQAVRDYDALLKSQGATGEARGFIYKGKVYLLSDELKGPQQIAEVLFHEVLGHYGLRGAFGDSLNSILQQIGTMRRRDVVAKAREYGLFNKDALGGLDKAAASDSQIWAAMSAKDRLSAAEEVLAEMAQTQPTIGFVQRAIAAIRNWLRANVPGFNNLKLTDADIVQAYILPARGYVTRSKETGAQSLERAMRDAGFSRTDDRINFSRTTEAAKAVGDAIKSVTVTNIKQRAGFKLTDYLGIGLQALGRRQIVDIYGDMLPLGEYNRLVQQMEADKNEGGAEADQLVTQWAKLEDEGKLADLMHDATLAQIDPAEDFVEGDDKGKYLELRRKYNLLSDDAKKVYADTRDSYKAHHAKVRSAIKERIERSEIKGERKAALLKQMDDEFFKAIKGVYFPLARFGQYAVTVKGPDGKVESVSRAETKAEAEALRNNLLSAFPRDKGFTVGRVMLSKDFIADRDAVGRGFMTELYQVLDQQNMDAAQRAELEDTLGQLYLSSLPDLSWAKHGIHRKGTPGFSQDARRAFAQNMFHGARYLAKLRYSDLMQDELTTMQKHVDDWSEVEDFDQNSAQRVVDEMNKRHESLMNPKSNPVSTWFTSLGFVFHLGLSPASAMVNLSQTALVAYPIMGAKWGFNKASAALLKASAEAAKGKNDITGSLNADELAAYNEAVRAGTIDVTMAHDLAGIAQGEDAGVMWKIRPVMRWASFLFHHAERFNRQVTFVAAYRLAREAGADHKAAFEQATKATYDGHFDYGAANRPRIMQGNVAKVLLLFKQYGQNMVYTLARNAQQAIKGESPEVRAQARKALGGLLATHAAAAGVLGLPMVTTLLAAASMIGGDDDEPWDAKVALQNMLADTFGQKTAEVLAHGLSRLTPWDISGRVGLDKLIFPDVQEGLEGQRLAESAMAAALGPVAGIGVNLLKGMQMMGEGRYAMGLEAMMPAALRGPVKALRYAEEGVQDKSGISILDEVSPAAVVGQALGFSPSAARNAQEGKSAILAQDRALGERRQELLTKIARATMAKDEEAKAEAREEIRRFNEKNPSRRINPNHIMASVHGRQKRIDQAEDGVYLPRNRRDAMDAGRFANAD